MKLRKGLPEDFHIDMRGGKRRTKRRIRLDRYYRMSKLDLLNLPEALDKPIKKSKKKFST